MNITTWHDDVGLPEMNQWLGALRDDGDDGPLGGSAATEPAHAFAGASAPPEAPGAIPAIPPRAAHPPQAAHPPWAGTPARASTSARAGTPAQAGAPASTARATIGDQLRRPIMWCEMTSCISYHADPAALGEADARARALRAGWRIDSLGRLACPHCLQTRTFWAPHPVVAWDRDAAMVMATLATVQAGRDSGRHAQPAWHHEERHPSDAWQAAPIPAQQRWHYEF
ncbi:MAG TPA: hypothetical protein VMH35_27670 [Streptosporangiaceae bacterium]|nr:hypothetical protein [Streptosporangiaceae bacterium]